MTTFNNIDDLAKWVNGSKGQNSLLNETQIKKALRESARLLEKYMKEELNRYFDSYTPSVYERTGNTLKSFRVSEPRKVGLNDWSIEIYFDDGLANHPSVMGQEEGYTPWLLEVGWNIEDKVGYSRPMFTKHSGIGYIKKAVSRFNSSNPHGFKVNVNFNGNEYI